ncbi:regulatory protein RecX [Nocardioides sp. URHA0020]|uniref:regulatory protein RecX n=1 Tax=Nocardioides sp. URHA0020 TaxID=1380392 RepID=UPI000567C5C8|nr:regulatory protein RecX [Nocardioides sp. URHA0020]
MTLHEDRPPPDWLGDVSDGVDAWTRRSSAPDTPTAEPTTAEPAPEPRARARRRSSPPPPDRAAQVPDADPEAVARKILLDQLTGQARSRQELADKLAAKLVPDDVATQLLDRFEEVGLIDDDAFARAWIASRGSAGSGSGRRLAKRALAQELHRKGIDREVAREALDEIDPADEEAAARSLVRAKLSSVARVDDVKATRRLVGMLARKGYGAGLAFAVVNDELAAAGRAEIPGD